MTRPKTRLPDFLLVGAAKSGTTAVYHFLKAHPEVFMSPVKEPKFLTSGAVTLPQTGPGDAAIARDVVRTFEDYCLLFRNASDERAVGEASADTLYYFKHSIPAILQYLGDVKIVIILRNPIDRAYSSYLHLRRDLRETLPFDQALLQESKRRALNWEFLWYYRDVGLYFEQVRAFCNSFSKVHVGVYDDLQSNPRDFMKQIYRFLGVTDEVVPVSMDRHNVSGLPRSERLQQWLVTSHPVRTSIGRVARAVLSESRVRTVMQTIRQKNLSRPVMPPEIRHELRATYYEDIKLLEKLLNKDLSAWLEVRHSE